MARKKIGELLIEAGVIDQAALRAALAEQARWGGPLGRTLVELRLVSEADLVSALSQQLNIPSVDLEIIRPPDDVLALISPDLAVDHMLIPFAREGKFLDVAMTDPTNIGIVDEIRIRTRLNVRTHLVGPKALERALARFYQRGAGMLDPSMQRDDARIGAPGPNQEFVTRRASITFPPSEPALQVAALEARIVKLEALLSRDEQVLRKLLALLVEKGVATRDEIMERLR